MNKTNSTDFTPAELMSALAGDIRRLIDEARSHVAATANATLTLLYWRIGQRIRSEVLGEQRAEYGQEIVVSLSRQLTADHRSTQRRLHGQLQCATSTCQRVCCVQRRAVAIGAGWMIEGLAL